jgi:integrase
MFTVPSLSSFFEWLVNTYKYPENPVSGVFSSHKTTDYSTTESLSRGEVVDMLTGSEAKAKEGEAEMRNYIMLACLFGLALRRSEVARLRWDDISKDGSSITIYRKGGEPQELPLPPKLAWYFGEFAEKYGTESPYIFRPVQNNRGGGNLNKPISTKAVFRIVRKTAQEVAPQKHITPHSLRKTFIELALSEKEDVHAIMNATGHSRVEMLRYYDTRDQMEHNAINRLARFL